MTNGPQIVHVLVDDKFIDVAIREFEAVTPGRHRYVMPGRPRELKYVSHSAVEFVRRKHLLSLLNGRGCAAIVFHSLDERAVRLLPKVRAGRSVTWLGWGFDYYDALLSRALPEGSLLPLTRALVAERASSPEASEPKRRWRWPWQRRADGPITAAHLRRVDYFSPVLEAEHRMACELNPGFEPEYLPWNYGVAEDDYGARPFEEMEEPGRDILVGNSATPTNNHVEVFELLSRSGIADDRRVVVPLSYGDGWYRDRVLERGRELLGDRFLPLTDFLPAEEYRRILRDCGHVFLNHVRQQAVANACIGLLGGSRVYVNERSPVHAWLRELGAHMGTLSPDGESLMITEGPLQALSLVQRRANYDAILGFVGREAKMAKTRDLTRVLLGGAS